MQMVQNSQQDNGQIEIWSKQVQFPWRVLGQMQQKHGVGGNYSRIYYTVDLSPEVNGEANTSPNLLWKLQKMVTENQLCLIWELIDTAEVSLVTFQTRALLKSRRVRPVTADLGQVWSGSYLILFHAIISCRLVKPLGFWPWNTCHAQYRGWKESNKNHPTIC